MKYHIQSNGTIHLQAGAIQLLQGYPAIDGTPLRPLRVTATAAGVRYELENGAALTIELKETNGELHLQLKTHHLTGTHHIAPIASLIPENCNRAFYQGTGMGGPSGFTDLDPKTAFDSDGVVAVGNEKACVTLHVCDHTKYRSHFVCQNGMLAICFDTEGVLADETVFPPVTIRTAPSFDAGLRACAREIADFMGARMPGKPGFHWCSWYYLYHTLDQPTLENYLEGFSALRDTAPFQFIQIDAGYFPSEGDWLGYNPRFPQGIQKAAETIRQAGYEPAIWVGPFMVGDQSAIYRDHPDWLLRKTDGTFLTPWQQYNEPKMWGQRDFDYCVLDTSHPDAMDYIRQVFRTLRAYGFKLYKTDFLFWGLQDSSQVLRHTPGKTSIEYFREFMTMVRQEIGEDATWLGCISPFMPAVGFVDMMRIGGDVGDSWEPTGFGPGNMIQETTADQYFNNVFWQNDPDATMLRDFHIRLRSPQVEALALLQAMSGGVITTSDPVHLVSEERKKLLKLITPHRFVNAEYPFWQEKRKEVCIIVRLEQGSLFYLFNPTHDEVVESYDWQSLLGEHGRYLFKLHGECCPAEKLPFVRIPPRSGVLFFASSQPIEKEPENLWKW